MSPGQMLPGSRRGDSCNLLYMFPGPFVQNLVQIGPVTAEILPTLSLCGWVVGGWWWWIKVIFVSNPTLVMLG